MSFTMSVKAPENEFAPVLAGALGPLLSSGKYSDLMIHCENKAWKVHRMVMCTHSKFFVNACEGEFKVREMLSLFIYYYQSRCDTTAI